MNVLQTLTDFKQQLHPHHPALPGSTKAALADAGTTSTAGSNSTTITANDFLQLLVAEMKNQDPTADQDPNAYIDQLVQVNSLQQLIAINQDLSGTSATGQAARAKAQSLGSAAGSPAASLSTAMAPRTPEPQQAPVSAAPASSPLVLNPSAAPATARP